MGAKIHLEIAGDELRPGIVGKRRDEVLLTAQQFEPEIIVQTAGKRNRLVITAAKRTVKVGVVAISPDVDPGQSAKGNSIQFVQRALAVAGAVALAQVRVEPHLLQHFESHPAAKALEEVLIEQASLDQSGVERG